MKSLSLLPVLPSVAKQFRNLPNFSNDLNTFLMPGWMLPGFAFMRAKGFAEVNAIYINNLAGDTIAEVDSAQMKACTTSSADYFKFSSKPTLNNALDGNSYLDNFTYLSINSLHCHAGIITTKSTLRTIAMFTAISGRL